MALLQDSILTVTLNPALDMSARVNAMQAGPKLRLSAPVWEPGGGGVNVARAIHELRGGVCAWVALGGASGARHKTLLKAQGVDVHVFAAPGDTRQSWAITDDDNQQFRLQLPGDSWPEETAGQALADITALADGIVVLSGSQPAGVGAGFAQDLAAALGPGRLIVDTSGAALAQLVEAPLPQARPMLLRLDQAEAESLAGLPLVHVADTRALAENLITRGVAEQVCLARGADGAVLAGAAGAFHCQPPDVAVRSKVGAGDSFTGAFALALAQGHSPQDALVQGTAAAAAAVMTDGSALCRHADVVQLVPRCRCRTLDA